MYAYTGNDPVNNVDPFGLTETTFQNCTTVYGSYGDEDENGVGHTIGTRRQYCSTYTIPCYGCAALDNVAGNAVNSPQRTQQSGEDDCVEPPETAEVLSKFLGFLQATMQVTGEYVGKLERMAASDLSKTRKGRWQLQRLSRAPHKAGATAAAFRRGIPFLGTALSLYSVSSVY